MATESDEISKKKRVKTIVADGTGFKKHPKFGGCEVYTNREVRVVIGITEDEKVVPYGAWTESKWSEIGTEIKGSPLSRRV